MCTRCSKKATEAAVIAPELQGAVFRTAREWAQSKLHSAKRSAGLHCGQHAVFGPPCIWQTRPPVRHGAFNRQVGFVSAAPSGTSNLETEWADRIGWSNRFRLRPPKS